MSLCSEAVDSFLRKSKSLMRGAHDRLSLSMEHLTDSQLANRKRKTGDQMAYDIFRTYLFVFYKLNSMPAPLKMYHQRQSRTRETTFMMCHLVLNKLRPYRPSTHRFEGNRQDWSHRGDSNS